MVPEAKFQVSLASDDHVWRDLVHGINFRLDEDRIPQVWGGYLPPLLRDLARVSAAVYRQTHAAASTKPWYGESDRTSR